MTNEQRIEPMLNYFGFSLEQMKSKSRKRELVVCRHFCMAILKFTTPMTLKSIARFFGRTDHATVIHAIFNVDAYEVDFEYKYHHKHFALIVGQIRGIHGHADTLAQCQKVYLSALAEVG